MLPPISDIEPADWDLVVVAHVSVLVSGPKPALDTVLAALRPHMRRPIHRWQLANGGPWPACSSGTLLLEQVAACPEATQDLLFRGLTELHRGIQVIATTDQPLFQFVQRGAFRADLYYRLNPVHLDLFELR